MENQIHQAIQQLWVHQQALLDGYNVRLFGELPVHAQRQLRTLEARETTLCDLIDCIDSVTPEEVDAAILKTEQSL